MYFLVRKIYFKLTLKKYSSKDLWKERLVFLALTYKLYWIYLDELDSKMFQLFVFFLYSLKEKIKYISMCLWYVLLEILYLPLIMSHTLKNKTNVCYKNSTFNLFEKTFICKKNPLILNSDYITYSSLCFC